MVRVGVRNTWVSELENFETPHPLSPQSSLPLKPSILSLLEDNAVASTLQGNTFSIQELTHLPLGHWTRNWGQVTTKTSWGSGEASRGAKEVSAGREVSDPLCIMAGPEGVCMAN